MYVRILVSKVVASIVPVKSWRHWIREFIMYRDMLYFYRLVGKNTLDYDYIVSLGDNCCVANGLRLAGRRCFSGPFDWLSGGDIYARMHCLDNNFADFCSHDDFVCVAPGVYRNKHTGFLHPHDFSKGGNFETAFASCADKYDRRGKRLVNLLGKRSHILFVFSAAGNHIFDVCDVADMMNKKFRATCDILFLERDNNVKRCVIRRISDNVLHGRICAFDNWGDWQRKAATRMIVTAMSGFQIKKE